MPSRAARRPGPSSSSMVRQEIRALADDILLIAQTIAKREGELRASIEQRDHMLREIHHRVKNNIQV